MHSISLSVSVCSSSSLTSLFLCSLFISPPLFHTHRQRHTICLSRSHSLSHSLSHIYTHTQGRMSFGALRHSSAAKKAPVRPRPGATTVSARPDGGQQQQQQYSVSLHEPLLTWLLEDAAAGRLSQEEWPCLRCELPCCVCVCAV